MLFSGGLDSAVLLADEHQRGTLGAVVHFVYPHPAQSYERRAVIATKLHMSARGNSAPWFEIDLPLRAAALDLGVGASGPRVVAARNAVFLSFAANLAASLGFARVVFGATSADTADYVDCRPDYIAKFSTLTQPFGVTVTAPLSSYSRAEIHARAIEHGLPISALWSCYQPDGGNPCGSCGSCVQSVTADTPHGR